jgi:hypothetical protein
MNVEIGTEAAEFPEKEYINGIAFAVCLRTGVTSKKKPKNIFFSQHRHCVAGL